MSNVSQHNRLYTIEFLRIWFILCIIIFHVYKASPALRQDLMTLFHSSELGFARAVDFFFIIGGFFLYKKLAQGTDNAFEMIKKIYLRLLPVTIFALAICSTFNHTLLARIPLSLAQLNGTGLFKHEVMGWGDWFIGVYFWTSCLFILLFQTKSKYRWLWLGILVYACFLLKLRNSYISEPYLGAGQQLYYGVVSHGFVYSISCMGVGMVSGYLAEKLACSTKYLYKILFTALEIICLVCIYKYMFDAKACRLGYLQMSLIMGVFMVSIANSRGYISTVLNKVQAIQYISRYTLPLLFGHIICFQILKYYNHIHLGDYPRAVFVIGGGLLLGIIEYHLIEKWLVLKIKKYFFHETQ